MTSDEKQCPKCKKTISGNQCPTCGPVISLRKVPKELEKDLMVEPMPCDEDFEDPDTADTPPKGKK